MGDSSVARFGGRGQEVDIGKDGDSQMSSATWVAGYQGNVEDVREKRGWSGGGQGAGGVEPTPIREDIETLVRRHTLQREHVSALCSQLQSKVSLE